MVGPRPFRFSDKRVPVRLLRRSAEGVHLFDAALGQLCGVDDLRGLSRDVLATDVEFDMAILDDVTGPVALESEGGEVRGFAVHEEPRIDGWLTVSGATRRPNRFPKTEPEPVRFRCERQGRTRLHCLWAWSFPSILPLLGSSRRV